MGGCVSFQLSCDQSLNQACGCLFGDGNYIHMMEHNLEALEKAMQELEERREDLLRRVSIEEDKGLLRLAQVQGWFSRVEGIESQVKDLLKAKSTETKRLCLFGYCSNKCRSSSKYGKKVSKKLKEVKELLSKGDFNVVAEKTPVPKVEKKHIQTTIGLDSLVEKAWNSLMKAERRTLGLYGMGGVGKTTLLARINNKFENELYVVIWVVVSKDLQTEGIQNQILRRLHLDKEWGKETQEKKASAIHDILSKKTFVLLLDDLWSEVDLNKIGVPPPTQDNGSKIVFTTRSKEVCKDMKADDELKVDCLSPDDSWELFRKIVGEIPLKCHEDVPSLARKVVEKCYGLPLALNVIGKAMACKEDVHEWRHATNVLNTASHEFPGVEEKILSILKFSYDGLEDENTKSCFRYCSLFPEDYEILKEDLIEYWIHEGFINGNRDEDGSNNQGHAIIGSLVRAHLLMDSEFRTFVKMHDLLREMALWIGKEESKLYLKSGSQLRCIPKDINWKVVRSISLMRNRIKDISCCHKCPNLSTLLLRDNPLMGISGEFFQFMPALVILDLSWNDGLHGLPEEISSLTSLQYLNLSFTGIKSLPMKGLRKLISLDLELAFGLQSIAGIGTSLPNLEVLKLLKSNVFIDAALMKELQLLEQLKILTANVQDASILESIQGIERLASSIRGLSLKDMSEEVVVLNTVALCGLQRLYLRDKNRFGKYLNVNFSPSIVEIINREKGTSIRNEHPDIDIPFRKLESLEVKCLNELKRICSNPPALPSLRKFVVDECPKLPKTATEFPIDEHQ